MKNNYLVYRKYNHRFYLKQWKAIEANGVNTQPIFVFNKAAYNWTVFINQSDVSKWILKDFLEENNYHDRFQLWLKC